jgi:two-component system, sensor histidine kinase and response regulator
MPTMQHEVSGLPQNEATASVPPRTMLDNDAAVFDSRAMLANIGGDDNLFRELIGLFLDRRDAMIANIQGAIAGGDSAALRHAAHTLKGSAANLCAATVVQVAGELEAVGRRGPLDEANAHFVKLQDAVHQLVETLRQEQ